MSVERACCTCQWWEARTFSKTTRNIGLCRVNPPTHNSGDDGEYTWPSTFDEDWCGRWVQLVRSPELPRQKTHDPVSPYEEQFWRSRGDSEEDIAARIAARGRGK